MPRAGMIAAIGGGLAVVIVVGLLLTRPDITTQTEAFFETLNQALADADAADVVDLLDPDYDIPGLWPNQAETLRGNSAPDAEDAYRSGLKRTLARALLYLRQIDGDLPQVSATVSKVEELADGTVQALVTIEVSHVRQLARSQSDVRLVFTQNGWLRPWLRLRSHDSLSNR